MRFMSMVKSTERAMSAPPKALMDAIDNLAQEAAKEGCVMVQAGGLLPTSSGMRVRLSGGKLTVTDGPFTEAKEVVGGYAIFDAKPRRATLPSRTRSRRPTCSNGLSVSWTSTRRTCRVGRANVRSVNSQRWARNPAAIRTSRRQP